MITAGFVLYNMFLIYNYKMRKRIVYVNNKRNSVNDFKIKNKRTAIKQREIIEISKEELLKKVCNFISNFSYLYRNTESSSTSSSSSSQ